jgi:paraquat-inducible protein B
VLSGPGIELDPGPGAPATHFVGLDHKPIAPAANSPAQPYTLSFEGAVGNLDPGDPVKLRGFTVGEVKSIGFAFDAKSDALSTPVTIDLYPSLFHVAGGPSPSNPAALRGLVASLVGQGLRAKLDREPPLIGAYHVVLDIEPDAASPSKTASSGAQIPTASSGGGIGSIVDKLKDVPVGQIAQRVLDVARHADALVSSPDLKNAIVQLDDALKQAKDAARQVNQTASSIAPKINTLIERLDRTASQLDRTAATADRAASSASQVISGTTSQYGLESTAREVTQAARAVRALADFLSRHPEALIRGRSGGE